MEIPRSGVIDPETINYHDFCYHCSKHGPGLYLVNYGLGILMINYIFQIKNIISSQIKINMLFKTKDIRKIRRCDKKIHKAMRFLVKIMNKIEISLLQVNQNMHVNWNC